MTKSIGLIGLGLVGTAMAESLLAQDFDVIGFDADEKRCRQLEKSGGTPVASPAEVAGRVERVILSLPDTNIVLDVVEGPAGILEAAQPPTHIIDTTTGDPDETISLAQRLARRGITFLDSTISGSSGQVRDRQAVFMVGGDKEAFESCRDVFSALADKVFYVGPSGSGSKAKLASNLILGLNRLALAEGLVFAEKLGLDLESFLELLKSTPAYSAIMDTKGEKMLKGDFAPQARVRQHHKDVALILKYADNAGQELPLSKVHLEVLAKSIAAGDADLDNSAIIKEIRRRNARRKKGVSFP
ncbi:MAG: NAD(P)-dependent oxidoreductase [Candidatus Zixiibacteriota bacterium]|nr:MAG: NAD(P)-dependent oxidoreductase [candidate division Zixibacteria bacterium]